MSTDAKVAKLQKQIDARMAFNGAAIDSPFTVLIDTREQLPYEFAGLVQTVGRLKRVPVNVHTRTTGLPSGDYSIEGHADRVAIERKSLADLYGTLGRGRDRFVRELERLDAMTHPNIVVEASFREAVTSPPAYSKMKSKTVFRSVLAWRHRYPRIHWHFIDDRSLAEVFTFRLLERFWIEIVNAGKRV